MQNTGAGRRRRYCGVACRRRAQRKRQTPAARSADRQSPLGGTIATEIHRLAGQLMDSELRREELATLLERAETIRRELDIYTAAAVSDARHRGEKWESVARAAHVAPETARARWGPERVARMMDLHANDKRAAPARWRPVRSTAPADGGEEQPADRPDAVGPVGRLAAALTQLQSASGRTIREVAEVAMLSPSYVSRVLSGDRLPTWDLVCALSNILGADPAELRVLFEAAHGRPPLPRQPVPRAIEQLHATLRGLHRAAKSPTAERIASLSGGKVSTGAARRVLSGHEIPDWEVLSALVLALGGRPSEVKPLWEAVHYAFLMVDDPGLPDGVAHVARPGPAE
ncbi:helix-turn-helix domain-containing protein [Streptomyces sp. NPDC091281]|uniref:helix-turn-helix domain-containing protein n=1 Tax=Streptomyces sp. NPDC091281 TaxID=3365985 RepID=UPI0037F67CA0